MLFFLDPWHTYIAAHMAQEHTIMTANMPKNTMWNNALGCHIGEDTFTKLWLILFWFYFLVFFFFFLNNLREKLTKLI